MMKVGPALAWAVVVVGACRSAGNTMERRGDEAYAAGQFGPAAEAYAQAAGDKPDPDILAKLGAARLRLGDYAGAAQAYRDLAASDALRVPEAVQGLDLAAQGAEAAGDPEALRTVLLAIHAVVPDGAHGRYAFAVMRGLEPPEEERLAFLPAAAAAAPDRRTADSLLVAYAEVLRESEVCGKAIRVFRSVLRRTEAPDLEDRLLLGRAECAYVLGQEILSEEPWAAEGWFLEAIDAAPGAPVGRRALLGLGEARAGQGDLIGAALAYQSAIDPESPGDSITIRAMERLNDIARASSDSGVGGAP